MIDHPNTTASKRARTTPRGAVGVAGVCLALGAVAALAPPAHSQGGISEYWFLFESRLPAAVNAQTTASADCWELFQRDFAVPGRVDDDPGTALQRATACGAAAEQSRSLGFTVPKADGATVPGLQATLALRPGDPPRLTIPLRPDGTPRWAPFPLAAGGGLVCTSFQGVARQGTVDISRISLLRDPRCASAGAQPGPPPAPPIAERQPDEGAPAPTDFLEVLGDACRIGGGTACEAAEAPEASDLSAFLGDDALLGVNDLAIRAPAEGAYTDVTIDPITAKGSGRLSVRHRSSELVGPVATSTTFRGQRVGDPAPAAPEPEDDEGDEAAQGQPGAAPEVEPETLPSQGAAQVEEPAGAAWRTTEERWTEGATRAVPYDLDFSRSDVVERDTRERLPLAATVSARGRAGNYAVLRVRADIEARPTYDAALELGRNGRSGHPSDPDRPQLSSPLAQLSGQSASAAQSCVGYMAASARGSAATGRVEYSLEDIGWRLQQSGAPPVRGLTDRFLSAASQYAGTRTQCKGFTRAFASAWEHAATGSAVGRVSRRSAVCVYARGAAPAARVTRRPGPAPETPQAQAAGCPEPLATTGQAAWIDAGSTSGASIRGTSSGDYITGDRATDVDTLNAGAGADIVRGGPRAERIFAGSGSDAVAGRGGNDVIDTGSGDDSADGGQGNDRMTARGGANHLDGGPGSDTLASRGTGSDTLALGGAGNDRLIAGGSRTNMWGGPGNDTYELRRGRAETVELADEGRDTIRAWVNARLAPNVEILRLQGRRPLRATGTPQRDVLIGNGGANRIDGGPGPDRLVGGAGNDTIILAGFGFETATGGPGRDRFELRSVPTIGPRGGGLERPAVRTAHRITDFDPAADRIVLRARDVGPEVLTLRGAPRIVAGPGALATEEAPTVVFDTATKLVTYDADGVGPRADIAVAVLTGVEELPASAFLIRS